MPGVRRGVLVNLWSVAPWEFSCEERGGEVHRAFWFYHYPQSKLINPVLQASGLAKLEGHNINYLSGWGMQ